MFAAGFLLLLLVEGFEGENVYQYKLSPDPNYIMRWKFDEEFITVEVSVKTKGWVFWGLSKTYDLRGADGMIAWSDDNNNHHLYDIHYNEGRDDNLVPILDVQQDYQLLQMSEANDTTTITFKRKLLTTDYTDFPITLDTMRIQWGWGTADPSDSPTFPAPSKRGVAFAYLIDYAYQWNKQLPKPYKTFEARMPNYKVPGNSTVEVYYAQKFPNIGRKKQHIIRVEMIISPGNENVVHHMKIFKLSSRNVPERLIGKVIQRYSANSWRLVGTIIHGYAMHTGTCNYPPEAGMPLETNGDEPLIISLNIHYNRPPVGMVDSSGVRFYITDHLRKYDSTIVQVLGGYSKTVAQIIPQQQHHFTEYKFFPSHCTKLAQRQPNKPWKNNLPSEADVSHRPLNNALEWLFGGYSNPLESQEIRPKLFAVLLHGHQHTTKIVLRLMNENTGKEVKTIVVDSNYEYSFQGLRYLKEPVEIPPEHRIDLECTRNTMDRETPLFGGPTTQDEMCEVFLGIYPRLNAWRTFSVSSNKHTWGQRHLGWKIAKRSERFYLADPILLSSSVTVSGKTYKNGTASYLPLTDAGFWKNNESRVRSFEQDGATEPYVWICINNDGTRNSGFWKNKPRILLKP